MKSLLKYPKPIFFSSIRNVLHLLCILSLRRAPRARPACCLRHCFSLFFPFKSILFYLLLLQYTFLLSPYPLFLCLISLCLMFYPPPIHLSKVECGSVALSLKFFNSFVSNLRGPSSPFLTNPCSSHLLFSIVVPFSSCLCTFITLLSCANFHAT